MRLRHFTISVAVADHLTARASRESICDTSFLRNFLVSEDNLGQNLIVGLADDVNCIEEEPQEMSIHPS